MELELLTNTDALASLAMLLGVLLSSLGISAASNHIIVSASKLAVSTAAQLGKSHSPIRRKEIAIQSAKKLLPIILRMSPGITTKIDIIIESVYKEWKLANQVGKAE